MSATAQSAGEVKSILASGRDLWTAEAVEPSRLAEAHGGGYDRLLREILGGRQAGR